MWKGLRKALKAYFGFSNREVNGFAALVFLMGLLAGLPWLYQKLTPVHTYHKTSDQARLDSLLVLLRLRDSLYQQEKKTRPAPSAIVKRFPFDPNAIGLQEWQQLGVPSFLGKRILKYREKGGRFRKKDDLSKIYDFPSTLYTQLKPYILLPDSLPSQQRTAFPKTIPHRVQAQLPTYFDLNTADSAVLVLIRGIGPGYAGRILRFRESLGGFYDTSQVREVYGLPPETASELLRYGRIGSEVKKMYINHATVEEINRHPYLRGKGKVIVAYRQQHGPFRKPEDLMPIQILNKEQVRKATPYLAF
jgi:competence protein ComEA